MQAGLERLASNTRADEVIVLTETYEHSDRIDSYRRSPVIDRIVPRFNRTILPCALCGVLTLLYAGLILYPQLNSARSTPHAACPPWPFPQIFDARLQTVIVVADGNYGMFRILTGERGSLEQYLQRDFPQSSAAFKFGKAGSRFAHYISNSTLTSFADLANAVSLMKIAGPLQKQVSVRSARDLKIRDLDHENGIFIGSPASNPWVSLFQDKLNFRESEAAVGNSAKAFVNTKPLCPR